MTVQFWNGSVLFHNGSVAMGRYCCCERLGCAVCSGPTPSTIDVDLSGVVAGANCTSEQCDVFNTTTITCDQQELAPCVFLGYITVCETQWTVEVDLDSDEIACVVSSGCNYARFEISLTSPYDCTATRSLTLTDADFALCCNFVSASCTITPKP